MIVERSMAFGVIIIALAVAYLAFHVARTLHSMRCSLEQTHQTLSNVQKKLDSLRLDEMSDQTITFLQHTNHIAADLLSKMDAITTLAASVEQIGEAVHQATSSLKQVSATVSQSVAKSVQTAVHNHQSTITEAADWAIIAMQIWHKWQAHTASGTDVDRTKQSNEGEDFDVQQ